jgi:hypothetical protein
MNLLEISDNYKKTGEDFLNDSGLISILERYGRVEFEGAFAGNVMLHGDVDMKVVKEDDFTNDDIFKLAREVYDICSNIRSVFVKADWDDPRLGQQFPIGKYLGLKTYLNEERWKFDIWLISEEEHAKVRTSLDISKMSLTEEQRMKILEFKKYRKDNNLKISGQEIYEAVLEKGITEPKLFFKEII